MRRYGSYGRRRQTVPMSRPVMSYEEKNRLAEEFKIMHPKPELKDWDNLDYYGKKRTHAKQYEELFNKLKEASDALKEFLNENIHKKARNPKALRQTLLNIKEYEVAITAWQKELEEYQRDVYMDQVLRDDRDHVAQTGRCCGQGKYKGIRTCSRRATNGNFCFQHEQKAEVFRRGK